jgi:hypothetical protein
MGIVHFIVVGNENTSIHLSGLQRFGCFYSILFTEKEEETSVETTMKEFGTNYVKVPVKKDYMHAREEANKEAGSAFNKGHVIAINMSCGDRLILEAVEDAVRLTQYYLLRHTSGATASAFRYFYNQETKKFTYIPYWNTSDFLYTMLFEILVSKQKGITLDEMHKEVVKEMGEGAPNWEAFRKLFREFKRYFEDLPFYSEGRGKKTKYFLQINDD